MSETAEEQEGRVVAQFRHHLPADINKGDGDVLLTILYKIGKLTEYLDDVARFNREKSDYKVILSTYFNFERHVKLDSEGRIILLGICWDTSSPYNLPSIIERLQKLQEIKLLKCQLIPIELGNLPLLKSITFACCDRAMFESIPERLVLSALKQVTILGIGSEYIPSLSAYTWKVFWNILPDSLEELLFYGAKREQADEILCALQNHDLGFRESLTQIKMTGCELNEQDLERLLFEILPRFANLHTLDLEHNEIESLQGIEDRLKKIDRISSSSSPPPPPPPPQIVLQDNKLRKLILKYNPVSRKVSNVKVSHDPKEVAAFIKLLDAFDGIYYTGQESQFRQYPSDVEYLLRINHAGRKFIKEGAKEVSDRNNPVIKLALWPKIFEKAHSKSAGIYNNDYRDDEEAINRRKCATGLFHLVRHFCGPLLAVNDRRRSCDNRETLATASSSSSSASASSVATTANRVGVRDNDALNHKRKRSQLP